VPSLYDLATQLQAFAAGTLDRAALDAWIAPVLAADPLDVEESDARPWEDAPDEERLFWRLLYLIDSAESEDDAEDDDPEARTARDAPLRALVARALACLSSTASPADVLELLPLVADQPRLCEIVERRAAGRVSRTGFLAVLANSGYPPHVKLWLQHADAAALAALCDRMARGAWHEVARALERAPARIPDAAAPNGSANGSANGSTGGSTPDASSAG
jgi:hypothetical protein